MYNADSQEINSRFAIDKNQPLKEQNPLQKHNAWKCAKLYRQAIVKKQQI